jgi:hypothetical protein
MEAGVVEDKENNRYIINIPQDRRIASPRARTNLKDTDRVIYLLLADSNSTNAEEIANDEEMTPEANQEPQIEEDPSNSEQEDSKEPEPSLPGLLPLRFFVFAVSQV